MERQRKIEIAKYIHKALVAIHCLVIGTEEEFESQEDAAKTRQTHERRGYVMTSADCDIVTHRYMEKHGEEINYQVLIHLWSCYVVHRLAKIAESELVKHGIIDQKKEDAAKLDAISAREDGQEEDWQAWQARPEERQDAVVGETEDKRTHGESSDETQEGGHERDG